MAAAPVQARPYQPVGAGVHSLHIAGPQGAERSAAVLLATGDRAEAEGLIHTAAKGYAFVPQY
jgi:hypothetical protein